MSAPSPTSPEQVGLRHARQPLQRILTRSGIDDAEASAHRGARAMAPALAALALAREIVDPWDGLIHRRVTFYDIPVNRPMRRGFRQITAAPGPKHPIRHGDRLRDRERRASSVDFRDAVGFSHIFRLDSYI